MNTALPALGLVLPWLGLVACVGPEKGVTHSGGTRDSGSARDSGGTDSHTGEVDTGPPVDATLVVDNAATTYPLTIAYGVTGSATISEDGATLEGELSYYYLIDDVAWCDMDVQLRGTAASGTCEDCDYAFAIDSEIVEDRGIPYCERANSLTLLADDYFINPYLGFSKEIYGFSRETYGDELYQDVLLAGIGYSDNYHGYEVEYRPGPYWNWVLWDGAYWDQGWADLEDQTLSWGFAYSVDAFGLSYYNFCNDSVFSRADQNYGGTIYDGDIICGRGSMDGWEVDLTAGQTLSVSVDAPDKDSYFEPYFFVNGPDGCAIVRASNNFTCSTVETSSGDSKGCAAARFQATTSGTFTILLMDTGLFCNGKLVPYDLYLDID